MRALQTSEELLEYSIGSIRVSTEYICVVYQTISNFGYPCDDGLEPLLDSLKQKSLIDEFVKYEPQRFSPEQKKRYAPRAT